MFSLFTQSVDRSSLPPTPAWVLPGFYVASLGSILIPQNPWVLRLAPGALLCALMYHVTFQTQGFSNGDYGICNSCVGVLYRWIDFFVLHTPERDFWQVRGDGKEVVRAPSSAWPKLKWFFALFMSQRGIGWNIQPAKGIPPGTKARNLFIKNSIAHGVNVYLIYDISITLLQYLYQEAPFFDLSLRRQVLLSWITAFNAYAGIEIFYTVFSLLCVGASLSPPETFPSISGAFRHDAWSVRQMWGVCWHQMLRRPCGEAGKRFRDFLGLKAGGLASRYTQIFVAFALSAFLHHLGAVKNQWVDGGWHQLLYFLMQPLAYILEDFVMFVARKMGFSSTTWTKALGYFWVFAWFSFSLRYIVSYQPARWYQGDALPSPIQLMLRRVPGSE